MRDPASAGDDKEGLLLEYFLTPLRRSADGGSAGLIGRGLALAIAGDVQNRLGAHSWSLRNFQAALRIGERSGSDEVVWKSTAGLASASARLGEIRTSLEHYRKAVLLLERFREKLPRRVFNPGFFKDKSDLSISFIRLLAEIYGTEPLPAYLEEAFAVAESSRARGFLDSLEEAGLDFAPIIGPEVIAEGSRLSAEVSRYMVALQTQDFSPPRRAELLVELGRIENAYRDLLIRMRRESPAYADLRHPGPIGFREARAKLLTDGTALVEFILGEEGSFVFWATKDALSLSPLPRVDEIYPLVRNYLKFLTIKGPTEFLGEEGGCRLFATLLGSFRDRLSRKVNRLIIIPDGYLNYLPFEALMVRDVDDKRSHFLIEDHEISYGPSASALVRLAERVRNGMRRKRLLAVFASRPSISKCFLFGYPMELGLLKYLQEEVAAISALFKGDQRTILEGTQADEETVKRLPVGDYQFVHFAVHGIFDDNNWRWSGLVHGCLHGGLLQAPGGRGIRLPSPAECQAGYDSLALQTPLLLGRLQPDGGCPALFDLKIAGCRGQFPAVIVLGHDGPEIGPVSYELLPQFFRNFELGAGERFFVDRLERRINDLQ